MWECEIELNDINRVYKLAEILGECDFDVDLMSTNRHYVIDAKSIMGILSLDLSRKLILLAHTDEPEKIFELKEKIKSIC